MFEARSISVNYGEKTILKNCSIKIKPNALTAVIGKNGSGKSTMLKALCQEITPHSGEIFLDNTPIRNTQLAARRAVFSQHQPISFGYTVRETVAIGRTPYTSISPKENGDIITKSMALTEVEHLAKRDIRLLSGGERQRVHIARVVAQLYDQPAHSSYFFFDEPTNNLDIYHQFQIMIMLRQLADKGFGVCVVAHDLNLISEYADHVIFMNDGEIIAEGKPQHILDEARLSAVYNHNIQVIQHPVKEHQLVVY